MSANLVEKTRNHIIRTVRVFDDLTDICADWIGLKALIRSIAINSLRHNGFSSLTGAQRLIGNDLSQIFSLLQSTRE